jgi:autotransporter translocation and assembly factor TamB
VSRAARILRRIGLVVGVLLVLLVLGMTFALNSNWAARRLIRLGLSMPGANTVHIAEVQGTLRGPLVLRGMTYDANGIHAEVDTARIRWKPLKLLLGRVELTRLAVTGVRLVLPDSARTDTVARVPRARPSLPLPVMLGDVSVRDIEVSAPGDIELHADSMTLGGRAQRYGFSIGGSLHSSQTGAIPVFLTGTGDLEHIELERSWAGLYQGSLAASGRIGWWPAIVWDLALRADSMRTELIHTSLRTWPGRVGLTATTQGTMDSTGLRGAASFDSVTGMVRGQPVSGRGRVQFAPSHLGLSSIDLHWGSVSLAADGVIDDTLALGYDLQIGNLRTVTPTARGAIHLQGAATGPVGNARIQARLEGRNLASGANRIAAIKGRAEVELGPRGRNDADLRGSNAVLASGHFDSVNVVLRGTRPSHRLTARLRGASDTVRLALNGGLTGQAWRGMLDTLTVRTQLVGGWRLEQPTRLLVSRTAGRIQPFCLAGDTVGEQLCGQGDWRGLRNWNVVASIEGLPAGRFGPARSRFLQRGNRLAGTFSANLEAHATNGLVSGNLRAGADTVLLLYAGEDQSEQRLALDSALINVISDGSSTRATLTLRVSDQETKDLLTLNGQATLPPYRIGAPLGRHALDVRLDGLVPDVGFIQPLLFGIDSLAGRVVLAITAKGTIGEPVIDGRIGLDQVGVGLPGRRAIAGTANLTLHGESGPNRTIQGEVRFSTQNAGYDYWYYDGSRRLNVDTAFAVVQVGRQGLHGDLNVRLSDRDGTGVGSVNATLRLPQYRRLGEQLAQQPVTSSLEATIPDLTMLQPFVLRVDSLIGKLDVQLTADGRVGAPSLNGTLRVAGFGGRWPSGTRTSGDLNGDLRFAVLPDDRLNGSLTLIPENATITIPNSETPARIRLEGTMLDLAADRTGVHGMTDLALRDSAGTVLATLNGQLRMPGLTRAGQSLASQRIEGRLEGRAEDLAFLTALTRQIDSAGGSAHSEINLHGTLNDSQVLGSLAVRDGTLRLPWLGILLEKIQFTGRGDQNGEIAVQGSMESGGGTLSITGTTPLLPSSRRPGRLEVRGDRFEMMDSPLLHAVISPRLDVRLSLDSVDVRGEVDVPVARLEIAQVPQAAIKPSNDVVIVDSRAQQAHHRPFSGQVRVNLGDTVSFQAFNFDAELAGSLLLQERATRYPTAVGTLRIEEGRYEAYGQDLTIRGGEIRYTGGPLDNPGLSIRATRGAQEGADSIVVGIRIAGTAKDPTINLFSSPAMSETQTLSYLLTGGPISRGGAGGNLLNKALTSLGLRGGNLLAATLAHQVGLQEATVSTQNDVRGTALQIGRFLAPNLYVSYAIGVFDPVSTLRLRYVLSNHITLLAETGKSSGADILIRKDAKNP